MAKKKPSPRVGDQTPPLDPEWQDHIPDDVSAAVADYLKDMRGKNKLAEKERASRDKCIELMKKHGIDKLRIDEGKQWLEVKDEPKLKTRKVKPEKDDTRQSVRA